MQPAIGSIINSLINRIPVKIESHGKSYEEIVNKIEAEDGSGLTFNICLASGTWIFLRDPVGNGDTEAIRSQQMPNVSKVVQVSNIETQFVVTVRSMMSVGTESIKNQLQCKYEVTNCHEIARHFNNVNA